MAKKKLTRKEKIAQQQQVTQEQVKKEQVVGSSKKVKLILGLIVGVLGFALYANTFGHEFVLDDSNAITENHVVKQGVKGIPTLLTTSYRYGYWRAEGTLYRPLSLVMFATEWELFPNNPFPGHLINVLLYALTGFLLFMFLANLLSGYHLVIPFFISLLYIAHPIHTEVVANIKSRDELVSWLLVVISFTFLLKYLKSEKPGFLVGAIVAYFVSFLSKESAITMLGVVPVMFYFFTNSSLKKIFKLTAFFAIGAGAYLILRKIILGGVSGVDNVMLIDNFLVGAENAASRYATATGIMGKYLGMLFFPHPLSIDYAYNQIPIIGWGNYKAIISLLIYTALVIVAIVRFKKKELWVFGIIFYLITVSLFTNLFITIGSAFGERFMYLPSLGFCITVIALLAKLFKVRSQESNDTVLAVFKQSLPLTAIMLFVLVGYSYKTISRNADWQNHYRIYTADVKSAPNSARLRYWHANEIMKEDALKAETEAGKMKYLKIALEEYNKALEIYPNYGDALGQRGLAYYRMGEREKAVADYKKAISLSVGQAKVYNNLAVIYGEDGNYREALRVLKMSLQVEDRYPDAHKNIGSTHLMLGEYDEAIEAYFEALKYVPEHSKNYKADVYNYIAICYQKKGDQSNAKKYYDLAYSLNPALRQMRQN